MNAPAEPESFRLVVVSAGTSDPSSTRLLADRTAQRAAALAAQNGNEVTVSVIELREIAADISTALVSELITPRLQQAVTALGEADGIIAAAPVYKAGPSGLFTSFFHVLDNDLLIAKPVVLAATAGTARHALVADDQMRPMFAYLRAMTVPTSLFAAPEDWSDPALNTRIDRAARELVLLMESGFAAKVRDESWQNYQHEFGSAGGTETAIDLDSDLMRLATGGSASYLRGPTQRGEAECRRAPPRQNVPALVGGATSLGRGPGGDSDREELSWRRGARSRRMLRRSRNGCGGDSRWARIRPWPRCAGMGRRGSPRSRLSSVTAT